MDARWLVAVAAALAVACGDTDVDYRGGEIEPGQQLEDSGVELDVEPVDPQADDPVVETQPT